MNGPEVRPPHWSDAVPDIGPLDIMSVDVSYERQRVVFRLRPGGSPIDKSIAVPFAMYKRIMAVILEGEAGEPNVSPRGAQSQPPATT